MPAYTKEYGDFNFFKTMLGSTPADQEAVYSRYVKDIKLKVIYRNYEKRKKHFSLIMLYFSVLRNFGGKFMLLFLELDTYVNSQK